MARQNWMGCRRGSLCRSSPYFVVFALLPRDCSPLRELPLFRPSQRAHRPTPAAHRRTRRASPARSLPTAAPRARRPCWSAVGPSGLPQHGARLRLLHHSGPWAALGLSAVFTAIASGPPAIPRGRLDGQSRRIGANGRFLRVLGLYLLLWCGLAADATRVADLFRGCDATCPSQSWRRLILIPLSSSAPWSGCRSGAGCPTGAAVHALPWGAASGIAAAPLDGAGFH